MLFGCNVVWLQCCLVVMLFDGNVVGRECGWSGMWLVGNVVWRECGLGTGIFLFRGENVFCLEGVWGGMVLG